MVEEEWEVPRRHGISRKVGPGKDEQRLLLLTLSLVSTPAGQRASGIVFLGRGHYPCSSLKIAASKGLTVPTFHLVGPLELGEGEETFHLNYLKWEQRRTDPQRTEMLLEIRWMNCVWTLGQSAFYDCVLYVEYFMRKYYSSTRRELR